MERERGKKNLMGFKKRDNLFLVKIDFCLKTTLLICYAHFIDLEFKNNLY